MCIRDRAKGDCFQIPAAIRDKFAVVEDELLIHKSLLGGLLQLHGAQLGNDSLRLLAGRFFALLGVDRFRCV